MRKILLKKSHDYRDAIVFKTASLQNVFCPQENEKLAFSNSSNLKSVLKKLCFRDGLLTDQSGIARTLVHAYKSNYFESEKEAMYQDRAVLFSEKNLPAHCEFSLVGDRGYLKTGTKTKPRYGDSSTPVLHTSVLNQITGSFL